jgi:hypothetical protein
MTNKKWNAKQSFQEKIDLLCLIFDEEGIKELEVKNGYIHIEADQESEFIFGWILPAIKKLTGLSTDLKWNSDLSRDEFEIKINHEDGLFKVSKNKYPKAKKALNEIIITGWKEENVKSFA